MLYLLPHFFRGRLIGIRLMTLSLNHELCEYETLTLVYRVMANSPFTHNLFLLKRIYKPWYVTSPFTQFL